MPDERRQTVAPESSAGLKHFASFLIDSKLDIEIGRRCSFGAASFCLGSSEQKANRIVLEFSNGRNPSPDRLRQSVFPASIMTKAVRQVLKRTSGVGACFLSRRTLTDEPAEGILCCLGKKQGGSQKLPPWLTFELYVYSLMPVRCIRRQYNPTPY